MIRYSLEATLPKHLLEKGGKIVFSTDNEEMYKMALNYLDCLVDAIKWRNGVVKVRNIDISEEEES